MTKQLQNVLTFVNQHDCGVTPCGVVSSTGDAVIVRIACKHADGSFSTEEHSVKSISDARIALGY